MRPRGWHLLEPSFRVQGTPISASLFDFGLYLFHNGSELLRRGTGPYVYLPKMEHYQEARLWNDVFVATEASLRLPPGTIRATALIETLPAAFQMEEILWELRDHSAGLNFGRWDYIFSAIKQRRDDVGSIFPDRNRLTMDTPFLEAGVRRMISVCHRHGAHAIGGMAAQIPVKFDNRANAEALDAVRQDKEREVRLGHDGTWVAHPALVPVAREVFDRAMPTPNQIDRPNSGPEVAPAALFPEARGPVTAEGARADLRVALRYLSAWVQGTGCVPIDHRMEDAATAEIARAQLWQWVHHSADLEGGGTVTTAALETLLREETEALLKDFPASEAAVREVSTFLLALVTANEFAEFTTIAAYPLLEKYAPPGT